MQRSFTFVLLLVVCLVIVGPLAAQDAPTPEPVGLRPDAPRVRPARAVLGGDYAAASRNRIASCRTHAVVPSTQP